MSLKTVLLEQTDIQITQNYHRLLAFVNAPQVGARSTTAVLLKFSPNGSQCTSIGKTLPLANRRNVLNHIFQCLFSIDSEPHILMVSFPGLTRKLGKWISPRAPLRGKSCLPSRRYRSQNRYCYRYTEELIWVPKTHLLGILGLNGGFSPRLKQVNYHRSSPYVVKQLNSKIHV